MNESKLQYEIIQWSQKEGYFCFHCPNGEKRDKRTANKLMAMGVKAGVPDLIFILPNGVTVWVELKSKKGKLSKVQEKFKEKILDFHHHYLLIQSDCHLEAVNYLGQELSRICHLQ